MQYTEQDLQKLVNEVEVEFTTHLAKHEAEKALAKSQGAEGSTAPAETQVETLAKAEDGEKKPEKKPEAKDESKEEKKPEGKEAPPFEAKKPEGEAKAPAAGEAAPEGEAPAPDAAAAPAAPAAAQGDEACDYDAEDLEHMSKMYSSMSRGELKAHHDACRRALDSQGMAKCGDMSMAKAEENKAVAVEAIVVPATTPSPEVELLKSENEAVKAKNEGLQKSLDAVTAILTKMVEKKAAPQGKAITSLEAIAKSEATEEKSLSKGEVTQILAKKAADPSLKKSDRDAINAFYLTGASIQTISHLLK